MIVIVMISNLYWTLTRMGHFSRSPNLINIFGDQHHWDISVFMIMLVVSLTVKLRRNLMISKRSLLQGARG